MIHTSTSSKYQLNKTDGYKVARGFLIVMAGAALTYLTELIPNLDFGNLKPLIVPIFGSLIELGRRWITDYNKQSV